MKSTKDISYSPYNSSFRPSDIVKFGYNIKSSDYLEDSEQLEITITAQDKVFEGNLSTFCLDSLYSVHKDVVQEILKKKHVYTVLRLNELYKEFETIFSSKEEIEQILFGNYLDESKFHNRPLSKLASDIYKETLTT